MSTYIFANIFDSSQDNAPDTKRWDLITRLTYYPGLTISDRYRLVYRFDLDFNLPGDWYFRLGLFDNYDSQPPEGFSRNDYGWSNSFGFKF